jgi:hypothetical protein
MSRWLMRSSFVALGVSVLAGLFLLPLPPLTLVSRANPILEVVLDINTSYLPGLGWRIPPNCSNWHELLPDYCTSHHQTDYQDANGDGLVSAGDNILETPGPYCWHIQQVLTSYFLSCPDHGSFVAESDLPPRLPGTPVCRTWTVVSDPPQQVHIDGWLDCNGNNFVDVCDVVSFAGACYHVDRIGCDVHVWYNEATRTRSHSWGWLKSLFRK